MLQACPDLKRLLQNEAADVRRDAAGVIMKCGPDAARQVYPDLKHLQQGDAAGVRLHAA